jgi:hypothetical protein
MLVAIDAGKPAGSSFWAGFCEYGYQAPTR